MNSTDLHFLLYFIWVGYLGWTRVCECVCGGVCVCVFTLCKEKKKGKASNNWGRKRTEKDKRIPSRSQELGYFWALRAEIFFKVTTVLLLLVLWQTSYYFCIFSHLYKPVSWNLFSVHFTDGETDAQWDYLCLSSGRWWRQLSGAGMYDPDLCIELRTDMPLWTSRTYKVGIDSFSCFSFCVSHPDFSFGSYSSSVLCPDNSGEADPHPQGPGVGAWPRPDQSEHSDPWPEWLARVWPCDRPKPGRTMGFILGTLNRMVKKLEHLLGWGCYFSRMLAWSFWGSSWLPWGESLFGRKSTKWDLQLREGRGNSQRLSLSVWLHLCLRLESTPGLLSHRSHYIPILRSWRGGLHTTSETRAGWVQVGRCWLWYSDLW